MRSVMCLNFVLVLTGIPFGSKTKIMFSDNKNIYICLKRVIAANENKGTISNNIFILRCINDKNMKKIIDKKMS